MLISWMACIVVAPIVSLALLPASHCSMYKTTWFRTKVDHFGYAINDTFLLKVLFNEQHFDVKNPGPIFFYTGNEGPIEMFANNTGLMWDWAAEFGALLVFAEHRFYGESMPFGVVSYRSTNFFGYLTIEQALADYADLVLHIKRTWPGTASSKVVAFGGSYGGMLAAWMRIKYPWIIDAALASSAPILQFQGFTPCGAFHKVATKAFRREGEKCPKNIYRSWGVLERKLRSGVGGLNFIREKFRICQPVSSLNFTAVRDWLYETYVYMAMMNYPYCTNFFEKVPGHPVRAACKYLQDDFNSDDELLSSIYKAINVYRNSSHQAKCHNLNSHGGGLGMRGWAVQTCNELVIPLCAGGIDDMFFHYSWDFPRYRKACEKKFGMTPDLYKAQMMFGGGDIATASNIIFSNGDLDPWSGGGLKEEINPKLPVIMIKDAAHHYDLRGAHPLDTAEVIQARNMEKMYIKRWLK